MLEEARAAGLAVDDDGVWDDPKRVDEVMKAVGGSKLKQLMREKGRIEDRLIASELEELEKRLGKLESRVSQAWDDTKPL